MINRLSWDEYWLNMVYFIASRSTDENTHIGAVCVNSDNILVSIGYNGFCRGADDGNEKRQLRPEKYNYFEHAERNAIFSAARIGTSLRDCTMYTNGIPCVDCARGIIQVGIKTVVVDKNWDENRSNIYNETWEKLLVITKQLFKEHHVNLISIDVARPLIQIDTLMSNSPLSVDIKK